MGEKRKIVGYLADGMPIYGTEEIIGDISPEILQDALGRIVKLQPDGQVVNMNRIVGMKSCVSITPEEGSSVFEIVETASSESKGRPIVIKRPPEPCSKVVVQINGSDIERVYIGDEIIPQDDYSNDFWNSHAYVYDKSEVLDSSKSVKTPDGVLMSRTEFEQKYIYDLEEMQSQRQQTSKNAKKTLVLLIGASPELTATGAKRKAIETAERYSGKRISQSVIREKKFPDEETDVRSEIDGIILEKTTEALEKGVFTVVEADFLGKSGEETLDKILELADEKNYSIKAIMVKFMPSIIIKQSFASPTRAELFREYCRKNNDAYDRLAKKIEAKGVSVSVVDEDVLSNDEQESPDLM